MSNKNAFNTKPDLSNWLKKQKRSEQSSLNGQGGPKVPSAHIQIIGKRRFGQIKDLK